MRKTFATLLMAILLIVATMAAASAAGYVPYKDTAYSRYGWITQQGVADENHHITLGIMLVGDEKESVLTTATTFEAYNEISNAYQDKAIAAMMEVGSFAEVLYNDKDEVIGFERIHLPYTEYGDYLDSQKYGGELTAPGGGAGNMVAAGWLLEKGDNTVTIGDGNHVVNLFRETYTLADDCVFYLVNNPGVDADLNPVEGDWTVTPATFEDAVICDKNEEGLYPGIPTRRNTMYIFDQSAVDPETGLTRADVSGAKVKEMYIWKNPTTVMCTSTPDIAAREGYSWVPTKDRTVEKTYYGWNGISIPFALMNDRFYHVGDTDTNCYLLVSDPDENGDRMLTMLDAGYDTTSYHYWLSIEACGYDPRAVDNMMISHGHKDHYWGFYELNTMIGRAHGNAGPNLYTSAVDQDGYLNGIYMGITLQSDTERYMVTHFNQFDTWVNFGKGVDVYPVSTPGHANDVSSFVFKMTSTETDEYFDEPGTVAAFFYQGGYGGGASRTTDKGYTRMQYRTYMMYIQNVVVPFMENITEHIWGIPQHSEQMPFLDSYKVCLMLQEQGKDVCFLDCWKKGREDIMNFAEKRIGAFDSTWMNAAFQDQRETGNLYVLYDQMIVPYIREAGYDWTSFIDKPFYEPAETFGPFKRTAGTYTITIDDAADIIIHHGYGKMNDLEIFKGTTNIYGADLSETGVGTPRDSMSYDPNGWYVQICTNVDDDYQGGAYFTAEAAVEYAEKDGKSEAYKVNWYVTENGSYKNMEGEDIEPKSGPVESSMGEDWFEILRTQRLNTEEEAQALADYLADCIAKGQTKFEVSLTNYSDIMLPEGYVSAANAPLDDPFLKSLDDDTIKVAYPGTGYYTLEEEPKVIEKCCELNEQIDLTTMFVPVAK